MRRENMAAALLVTALTGCGAGYQASHKVDLFTDQETCVVEPSGFTEGFLDGYLGAYRLTLFAERRNGQNRIGIRSRAGLPVGDIQIRIDRFPAITLTLEDVPLDTVRTWPSVTTTPTGQTGVGEAIAQANRNAARAMSPYRVATGGKAERILTQIEDGNVLRFRQIGLNQALSTTAEMEITEGFRKELKKCGIAGKRPG